MRSEAEGRDLTRECHPISPTSARWRCARRTADGREVVFGKLHCDHEARAFRIVRTPGEVEEETYPTMCEAADALLAHAQREWLDTRNLRLRALEKSDAIVALIGRPASTGQRQYPSPSSPASLNVRAVGGEQRQ